MPEARPRRRAQIESVGRQPSGSGGNGTNGSGSPDPVGRAGQGISAQDADLLLSVLREVKRGNFSVRVPDRSTGPMAAIAAEINGIIELNERNTKNLSAVARVISSVAEGDLYQTMDLEPDGRPLEGQLLRTARTVNSMVHQLRSFTSEVTRVAEEVGTDGKLGGQAHVRGAAGVWKDLTDNVNLMAANLTAQVRNIADVTTAVANGDLSRKITVDVRGEILELKNTINTMVDQLNAFASEVTRVAREVGTEGRLGGQAQVRGIGGVWKDLTENVNYMASNLTTQVRNIADVTTAVQRGDLSKKITVEVQGEILELKNTINVMVDQLNAFASEVTRVAREVGTEGRLGGQAYVPGASGTWRDLTDNVNSMAGNLTAQVRNIAEVTTAVTEGDMTRSIGVDARGEVALLKDKINQMIRNLADTTIKNRDQDWLKTNIAKHTRMLQGQRDLRTVADLILTEVAPLVYAHNGAFYIVEAPEGEPPMLRLAAGYALTSNDGASRVFRWGEGLVGQCARDGRRILLTNVPAGYVAVRSGLGEAPPATIIVLPVIFEGRVKAVIELASMQQFSPTHLDFLDQLTDGIGVVINTLEANMRTEELLKQSQILFAEAQEASKSKSAFLSMAAHELRTPLSVITGYLSMLEDGTLSPDKWQRPLKVLIGKATIGETDVVEVRGKSTDPKKAAEIANTYATAYIDFRRQQAVQSLLAASNEIQKQIDDLQHQIDALNTLGTDPFSYSAADRPWVKLTVTNDGGPGLIVEDHGIGIPRDKQEKIFERFYRIDDPNLGPQPGTGLGLFISRELAERHGGSLIVERSEAGKGSIFVLRLPAATAPHPSGLLVNLPSAPIIA